MKFRAHVWLGHTSAIRAIHLRVKVNWYLLSFEMAKVKERRRGDEFTVIATPSTAEAEEQFEKWGSDWVDG